MPPRRGPRRRAGAPPASSAIDSVAAGVGTASASSKRTKRVKTLRAAKKARRPLPPGGALQLSEIGERLMLSFLPCLPDRMIAERVCTRWRRLSRDEVPISDLDFSKVSMRKVSKSHLRAMLARATGNLISVSLPGFSLDDASLAALMQHTRLKHMRAYTLSRKQIFALLEACTELESLELLDCQLLLFTRWEPQPAHLQSIRFRACHTIRTPAIVSMITQCGDRLKQLELTGAEYVDSTVFPVLARHATSLQELTISFSRAIRFEDLQVLFAARCDTLRLLDLTSCSGFSIFPDTAELTALEVLILDNTPITDEGLRAIAHVAPQLKYLSLQDCRVADEGVTRLAECTTLELLDLKGTQVADVGVEALDAGCATLRMLRLDSCRGVSRSLRLRHGERTRTFLQRRMTTSFERMAVARIATPEQIAAAAAVLTSDSENANDSDKSYKGR